MKRYYYIERTVDSLRTGAPPDESELLDDRVYGLGPFIYEQAIAVAARLMVAKAAKLEALGKKVGVIAITSEPFTLDDSSAPVVEGFRVTMASPDAEIHYDYRVTNLE